MSNYANPLDHYRSYSYHFILTASATTQALSGLIGGSGGVFNNAPQQSKFLGAVQAATLGGELTVDNQKAYLLVDTRRFSQYSITDIEMAHMFFGSNPGNPTMPASALKVRLIDTTGLTFVNLLADIMRNKLQTSRSSTFFLLTILFVGHKDDGTTEVISQTYIPTFLLQFGFNFGSTGSTYEIDLQEIASASTTPELAMIAGNDHMDYLGDVKGITTQQQPGSPTLGNSIQALEDALNLQSLRFYQKFNNQAFVDTVVTSGGPKYGKLVQYMITLPEEWRGYIVSTAARSQYTEQLFTAAQQDGNVPATTLEVNKTNIGGNDQYVQFSFSDTCSVSDAINSIMTSSLQILDLASLELRKAGKAVTFRTVMSVTSDETTYVVHFDIFKCSAPRIDDTSTDLKAGSTNPQVLQTTTSSTANLITYDYLYTGRNSHINNLNIEFKPWAGGLALDTNISLGKKRMADLAAASNRQEVNQQADPNTPTSTFIPTLRPSDPVFYPKKTKDQANNNATLKIEYLTDKNAQEILRSKQEFSSTMAFIHYASSLSLSLTIRGNPTLLRKCCDVNLNGGVAPHVTIINSADLNAIPVGQSTTSQQQATLQQKILTAVSNSKAFYYKQYIAPRLATVNNSLVAGQQVDPLNNSLDPKFNMLFAKVNIKAPNVDLATGLSKQNFVDQVVEPLFTEQFFYNGAYQVSMINTSFKNGEFEQTLHMFPYDLDGDFSFAATAPAKPATKGN